MSEPEIEQPPRFRVGELVRRRSSPNVVGCINSLSWDEQDESWRYRILVGNALKGVAERDLEPIPDDLDPWVDARGLRFGASAAFRSRLTFERLRKPPSTIAASFGSARAAFYAYQFKPLLKFLDNPRQRLLIADDVGLGKTIEAGYILREIRARHGLERVLIIVPARLQPKWKNELASKFDEKFEIVRSQDLLHLRHSLALDREPEPFLWITSYETARHRAVIEMFEEYEPNIDLIIVDEAHRMRHTATLQHRIGRALAAAADAMVLLTATPTQTGLADVFNLLRLLDPDAFDDFDSFAEQADANKSIIRLAQSIRTGNESEARSFVRQVLGDQRLATIATSDLFASIASRIESLPSLTRPDRIELQRDVAELSMTSQILSRTRKADVLPDRPQRRAQAFRFDMTAAEKAIYDSVADICRRLRPDIGDWGLAMATTMAYRYTASCIPAALDLFRERLGDQAFAETALHESDSLEFDDETTRHSATIETVHADLVDVAQRARAHEDTKFDQLRIALESIANDDRRAGRPLRKVIIFSYFKRTLRYLSGRLSELGIEYRHIDGDIAIADREIRIEQFATVPQVRVLLSSEVGSEGLDLQAASVVVNYDLPWNPMVLEQRIGRIDRLLQRSSTLTIVNLVARGTIEERILLRLYERIGIFRDTIGDMEPILGDSIEKLALEALRGDLTEAEERQRVEQTADAINHQRIEATQLGAKADGLLAADQAFLDEIESLVGRRRMPAPEELFEFVAAYFRNHHTGARFPRKLVTDAAEIRLPPEVAHEMRRLLETESEVVRVARRIESGAFFASFDQRAAMDHPRAELIHSRHPIVRLAFETTRFEAASARSFALKLGGTDELSMPAGLYIFSVYLFDMHGIRDRTEITPFFVRLPGLEPVAAENAEALYLAMLGHGDDLAPLPEFDHNLVPLAQRDLRRAASAVRKAIEDREGQLDAARRLRRKATLAATLQAKANAAERRWRDLEERGAGAFAVRMAKVGYEKATYQLENLQDGVTGTHFSVDDEEIAVGLLLIGDEAAIR